MKRKHEIEQQVEETLRSLDGIERAKANPFLYTRVHAMLSAAPRSMWERVTSYISKPVIALAMLCLVILTNAAVVYWQSAPDDTVAAEQPQLALTEEYHLTVAAIYDEETPEP